jgi:hypothetical protein
MSSSIVKIVKSWVLTWVGQVAWMGQKRNSLYINILKDVNLDDGQMRVQH